MAAGPHTARSPRVRAADCSSSEGLSSATIGLRDTLTPCCPPGGSLAEHEQQTPALGACYEMPDLLLGRKSVLALDDAGHEKVAILGLAEYRHQVTRAQQLQNRSFNAPQQQYGLIAVSGLDQDGWSGQ